MNWSHNAECRDPWLHWPPVAWLNVTLQSSHDGCLLHFSVGRRVSARRCCVPTIKGNGCDVTVAFSFRRDPSLTHDPPPRHRSCVADVHRAQPRPHGGSNRDRLLETEENEKDQKIPRTDVTAKVFVPSWNRYLSIWEGGASVVSTGAHTHTHTHTQLTGAGYHKARAAATAVSVAAKSAPLRRQSARLAHLRTQISGRFNLSLFVTNLFCRTTETNSAKTKLPSVCVATKMIIIVPQA